MENQMEKEVTFGFIWWCTANRVFKAQGSYLGPVPGRCFENHTLI